MNERSGAAGSDDDVAVLAEIVAGVEAVAARLTVAEVAQLRLLARAGQLARQQAAGSAESVRIHEMALRSIAAEVGGVLRLTDRTVQSRIGEAQEIVEHYPAALAAWEGGRITRGHVRVIVDAGAVVPAGERAAFEQEAIARCVRDTPNRVRAGWRSSRSATRRGRSRSGIGTPPPGVRCAWSLAATGCASWSRPCRR